jgi:hypothetical protein
VVAVQEHQIVVRTVPQIDALHKFGSGHIGDVKYLQAIIVKGKEGGTGNFNVNRAGPERAAGKRQDILRSCRVERMILLHHPADVILDAVDANL